MASFGLAIAFYGHRRVWSQSTYVTFYGIEWPFFYDYIWHFMVYFGNTTKSSLTYFYSFSKFLTYKVDSIVEHTGF